MKETIEKIKTWVMENKTIAGVIGAVVLLFLAKKLSGKMTTRRRRRRIPRSVGMARRRRKVVTRSVGMSKPRRSNANRVIKSGRNRGKKAWQIKGSEAARRHMAAIRRKRSRKLF